MTKGEWEVIGNFVAVQKEDGNSYEICKVSMHDPEWKSNAQLITAAPDMYWALKNLVNWLEMPGEHGRGFVMTEAKKALKKAEECGQ